MAVPVLERPPKGMREPWLGVWRASLRTMREQGTWTVAQAPLLDLYVSALQGASKARLEGKSTVWDRYAKRAMVLAGQLALTPRGRKAAGVAVTRERSAPQPSPFSKLDRDELAYRRERR
jgi:hypothetical protein